jgi:hypothetical protein
MARKRKVNHAAVVRYAWKHSEMSSTDIARHFQLSGRHVRAILQAAGEQSGGHAAGRPPVRKSGQTEEQLYWESLLVKANLGMDRGARIENQRIFYGFDTLKETVTNESVSLTQPDNP